MAKNIRNRQSERWHGLAKAREWQDRGSHAEESRQGQRERLSICRNDAASVGRDRHQCTSEEKRNVCWSNPQPATNGPV